MATAEHTLTRGLTGGLGYRADTLRRSSAKYRINSSFFLNFLPLFSSCIALEIFSSPLCSHVFSLHLTLFHFSVLLSFLLISFILISSRPFSRFAFSLWRPEHLSSCVSSECTLMQLNSPIRSFGHIVYKANCQLLI